jgi:hypothetical protein
LVLLAIADSANGDEGTGAWPSMETLAAKTRLGRRQVQKLVDRLEKSGELAVEPRRGKSNVFSVRVRCEREDTPSATGRCERECTPGVNRRTPPPVNGRTPRTVRESKRKQDGSSSFLEGDAKWLETLTDKWRTTRGEVGLERFRDPNALKWLREATTRALTAGCERQDVERAISNHVEEDFADPRQLDQWAAGARDKRLAEEKQAEAYRQHAAEMEAHQAEIDAEWAVKERAGDEIALNRRRNRERLDRATLAMRPW